MNHFRTRARRLLPLLATIGLTMGLAVGLTGVAMPAAGAATAPAPVVSPSSTPALALDAPDPDIVQVGSTFYAFTTGTTWGNQIGIAMTTAADPSTGWKTVGSAFPGTPYNGNEGVASWEENNKATSPGVFRYAGKWIMFYDAIVKNSNGLYCLSVATATSVTGPYTDTSTGSFECQPDLGGSIDPHPFVDPQTGGAYLLWKNNAGGSAAASQVWSAPITADGLGLAAAPTAIFTIQSATYSWQTTTDDPSMVFAGGHYYLFFSGGDYLSNYYPVGYVLCGNGPRGGCDQNEPSDPILSGYGGTGGGMEFTDASGAWWIAYQTWSPNGCTNYPPADPTSCKRQLFIAPISLPPVTPSKPSITTTALPKAPLNSPYEQALTVSGGTAPYSWSITSGTLPAGLALDAATGRVSGTPTAAGTQTVTFQVTDAGKLTASATMTVTVVPANPYSPLSPVRICDSRPGNPSGLAGAAAQCNGTGNAGSTLAPQGTKTINVAGGFGVPADATAVVLNVTVANPQAAGYVTVYPAGAAQPFAANISYVRGEVVSNLVEVGTGAGGAVAVFSQAAADVVVDVQGYTDATAAGGSGAGLYEPLAAPLRICDTRGGDPSHLSGDAAANCNGVAGGGSTLHAGGIRTIHVGGGSFGVPGNATAAVFNVTVANPDAAGYLTAYPAGENPPLAANFSYTPGQVTGNRVVVPLSAGASPGEISIFSSAGADVIVDASGYYSAAGTATGSRFNAEATPVRICDTRGGNPSGLTGSAAQCNNHALGPAGTLTVQAGGLAGVPAGATAVVVDVADVAPTAVSYLTVFPGPPAPTAADLSPAVGETRANLVVATLGSHGTFSIYNNAGSTNVVVDVEGWYS